MNEDLIEFAALAGPVSGPYVAPDLSRQMNAVDDAFIAFEERLAAGLPRGARSTRSARTLCRGQRVGFAPTAT